MNGTDVGVTGCASISIHPPGTRVVLSGLSHGGLIAAIAAARVLAALPPADRKRVGLVTAGAHLQWAYQRGFPAVLPHTCLCDLAAALGGAGGRCAVAPIRWAAR